MTFESDAFINYAHIDNLPLIEGHSGWVEDFHRALEIRISQLRGKQPQIWRDPKLQGNDYFADTLVERLRRVAVLVSIVSPPYVHSEWTRRELAEFWKAASETGGIRIGDKARVFKVLKTPVPLDRHPSEIQPLLGYEFFKRDPATGRFRELNKVFGEEAQQEFWMKLDDLAHDVCALLDLINPEREEKPAPEKEGPTVYLAETTHDLRQEYDCIRRELQEQGCTVLPCVPLPFIQSELRAEVQEQLERCGLSIHLVGRTYSLVPEGGDESLIEIQNDLAIERAAKGGFSRLVWIPQGLEVEEERQRQLLQQLRLNPRIHEGSDLLEVPLERLKTVIHERLRGPQKQARASTEVKVAEDLAYVYLIYDQQDKEVIRPWAQFLFKEGIEVIHPDFESDAGAIREYHEENLRNCDAVLIYYGSASEAWLRRKLGEIRKITGYGRTRPMRAVTICLGPPRTPVKENLQTHEADLVPYWDGFAPDPLLPFVRQAKGIAALGVD